MSAIFSVAGDEWRLWLRSKVAMFALGVMALIITATSVLTAVQMAEARHERLHQQAVAEETFLAQPDRHPHRMVHYGHYVFRAPPPLAIIDPGVDSVTGQSIFLEGHRQNTAMFADTRASANVGSFEGLVPAAAYQLLVPLVLIALGHGVFVREREAGTLAPLLAQGLSGRSLFAGKFAALAGLSAALLVPLAALAAIAAIMGESLALGLAVTAGYGLYLLVWCALIALVSAAAPTRGLALGVLVLAWLAWALVVPRMAVATASSAVPAEGKLETDLRMSADLRALGDGHNTADPAFAQLRANLLAQYGVEQVEDLPVNFRGVVAQTSEAELTRVMNEYAGQRMALETAQSAAMAKFGWLSPVLAASSASRILAGTDLTTHHRFLREAETVRYDFVRGLNEAHISKLSYADDINRNQSEAASLRARVSSENWAVLDAFEFAPSPAAARWSAATAPLTMLVVWLAGLVAAGVFAASRLKP
ncbi:MAG: DUF3526 domain-containing protein [Pseudomonadota bacterium]